MSGPGPILPVVVDGEVRADGRIDVLALGAGFQHGEGLFETLPLRGGRPLFLAHHLRRLADGAKVLGLEPIPAEATWRSDLDQLAAAAKKRDVAARMFLFRDGDIVRRAVAASALPRDASRPAKVGFVADELNGPRPLARLKTLNYLVPRQAHCLGAAAGFDEVLFTLSDGTVLEGTRSTVFVVHEGVVRTPPLSLPILPGVTREILIEEARAAGIEVLEETFRKDRIAEADEAFLSASLRGVRPIQSIAGTPLRIVAGAVTRRLQTLFAARGARE